MSAFRPGRDSFDAGGGGYRFDAGLGEITGACCRVREYGSGGATGEKLTSSRTGDPLGPMTSLMVRIRPLLPDGKPDPDMDEVENEYRVGDLDRFQPTDDPEKEFDADLRFDLGDEAPGFVGYKAPNKNSKVAVFIQKLVEAGFDESKMDWDFGFLVGMVAEFAPYEFKDRNRALFTIPVVTKIVEAPYDRKGKARAEKPKGAKAKGAKAEAEKPEADPEDLAFDLVCEVITEFRTKGLESVTRNRLISEVGKAAKGAGHATGVIKGILEAVKDGAVLDAVAAVEDFTVDERTLTLL